MAPLVAWVDPWVAWALEVAWRWAADLLRYANLSARPPPSRNAEFEGSFAGNLNSEDHLRTTGDRLLYARNSLDAPCVYSFCSTCAELPCGCLCVSLSQRPQGEEGAKLYVAHLPTTMGDDQLGGLFQSFGRVLESKVITDRETRQSKGYGFIQYETVAIAQVCCPSTNLSTRVSCIVTSSAWERIP